MKSLEKSFENLASEWAEPQVDSADRRDTSGKASLTERDREGPRADVIRETDDGSAVPRSGLAGQTDSKPVSASTPAPDGAARSSEPIRSRSSDGHRGHESDIDDEGKVDAHLVCLLDPRSEHAESYYRLRYQLESRRRSDAALVVGVTSPCQGDGKTLTGVNLAGALAKDSASRVLLLDLDLRRKGAGLPDYLGMKLDRNLGIVDWIRETAYGEEQFTHYLHRFNLHVMAAGSDPELPYELLKSSRLDDLIRRARKHYDFVIIDTPQILRLPDTELISRLVDGFVIVVKAEQTRQSELAEALNLMSPDKVLGLLFNAASE